VREGLLYTLVALVLAAPHDLRAEQRPEAISIKRADTRRQVPSQTRSRLNHRGVAAQSPSVPAAAKQFEETSYYLKDIAMTDSFTGWAVGEPHWDQAAKQYKGTIIKTQDAGVTWIAQEAGVAETFNGVCFTDASHGWAVGTNGAIVHTADGGAHWARQAVATSDEFRGVVFTDAGNGWATSARPVHYDWFGDADDWLAAIWHTSDGGTTWVQQQTPGNASILNRIDFVDSMTGWAAGAKLTGTTGAGPQHAGAIYHTADGGRTWAEQYSPELQMTFTGVDFVDAMNGWVVGFATLGTVQGGPIYHTSDGGKTWNLQTPATMCQANLWDVQFVDQTHGYAVGTNYPAAWGPPVCRTMDGGITWTAIIMNSQDGEGLYGVAVVGNRVITVGDHDFVGMSTTAWDPGETGQSSCINNACLFTQTYLNTHYVFHDVFFTDQNHGCAVGSQTFQVEFWGQVIFCTTDGGATWQTTYTHAPPFDTLFSYHRLDGVYFTDRNNGWAVGASETYYENGWKHHGAILHTTDGGQTWQEQGSELYAAWDLEFSKVQFLNAQNGWALAAYNVSSDNITLAHTTDGGNHWQWVDTGIKSLVAVGYEFVQGGLFFSDSQHGWVAAFDVAAHTEDGGAHWVQQTVSCGYPVCYVQGNAVAFTDNQNGWIAGDASSKLYRTTDAGAHWLPVNLTFNGPNGPQDIQFVDSQSGWLADDTGALMNTTDGGTHWQSVESGTTSFLRGLYFLQPQLGWIVGYEGTILNYTGGSVPVGPPVPAGMSPAAGSGSSQTITFTFSDPRGYQDLGVVNILVNNFLDGRHACYLAYSQPGNVLYLVNDAGSALLPGSVLTSGGSTSNSQCTVSWGSSAVIAGGNTLKLTLTIQFSTGFAGSKVIYVAAGDSAGSNSGWLAQGVWQVPGAAPTTTTTVNGMTAASGTGLGPTPFTFGFTDTKGYQDLGVENILVNSALDGRHACYLAYARPSNVLYLVNDNGDGLLAGQSVGASGSISNSQCTVTWGNNAVTSSGNNLTLSLNIGFHAGFGPDLIFYLAARDGNELNNTGWQAMGAWVVQ